jgi:hypothetical protein
MTDTQRETWVFGYGSLIWGTGAVKTVERREGILPGWHREWTWISSTRHGSPTCSLERGGRVKGVFLLLNPETASQDLDVLRRRENRATEETSVDIPKPGVMSYFWTMGNNLRRYREFGGLQRNQLARALAQRAAEVTEVGPDGVTAVDYIRKVHSFDPDDAITAEIARFL